MLTDLTDTLSAVRTSYAEEIRAVAAVESTAIVHALATVPREAFFDPGPWTIGATASPRSTLAQFQTEDADPRHLYHNVQVGIDPARRLFSGLPSIVAGSLDLLALEPGERLLHIGCGVGYGTALAAVVLGHTSDIVALEILDDIAARARANLRAFHWVSVIAQDASARIEGSFDAILVSAGFTHPLPAWLEALKDGGRLVMPLTAGPPGALLGSGALLSVRRDDNSFPAQPGMPVTISSSPTGRDDALAPDIREALFSHQWRGITCVRRDRHVRTISCCVHGQDVCVSCAKA
jgi:protein-L-isoaspartate(D-aspartate) O-methyltransferase